MHELTLRCHSNRGYGAAEFRLLPFSAATRPKIELLVGSICDIFSLCRGWAFLIPNISCFVVTHLAILSPVREFSLELSMCEHCFVCSVLLWQNCAIGRKFPSLHLGTSRYLTGVWCCSLVVFFWEDVPSVNYELLLSLFSLGVLPIVNLFLCKYTSCAVCAEDLVYRL